MNNNQLVPFAGSGEITDDQVYQMIEVMRTTAALPDELLAELLRTNARQMIEVGITVNSAVGELINIFGLLREICAAVTVGPDAALRTFLKDYPEKLSAAVARAVLANDQLKTIAERQIVTVSGTADFSELPGLVGKYVTGIRSLLPASGNSDLLHEIVADSKLDFADMQGMINRLGRPPGMDPLQRKIAELAEKIISERADLRASLSWPDMADIALSRLYGVKKRSADEVAMIKWFEQIGADADDKKRRRLRGVQFRKAHEQYQNEIREGLHK